MSKADTHRTSSQRSNRLSTRAGDNLDPPGKPGLFISGPVGSGKTLVAATIAKILADQGFEVGPFKPIAVGCHYHWEGRVGNEARCLALAANSNLPLTTITPIAYGPDLPPVLCAERLNQPLDLSRIVAAYEQICATSDIVLVEGIDGPRTPLTEDYQMLDLITELQLPVVLVARISPSIVTHTLLTIDCFRRAGVTVLGVVVNGYDATRHPISADSAAALIRRFGKTPVLAEVPFDRSVDTKKGQLGKMTTLALASYDWRRLVLAE